MAVFRRMQATFLPGHWGALLASLLLALAAIGFSLTLPWLVREVVDRVLIGGRRDLLLPLTLTILAMGLMRLVTAYLRRTVSGRMSLAVETEVRDLLFAHLQRLGFRFYLRWPTGQLISRAISDVRAVRLFLSYGLIFVVTHLVTLVAVAVILFALSPSLAALSLLPAPLLLLIARRFSRRLHPSLWAIQQRVAELTAVAEERILGIRVIKAFALEDLQQETFAAASDRIYRQHLEAASIRGKYIPLLGFLPSLSLIIVLYFGGRQVIEGDLTLGSLLAFNGYLLLLIWPLRMLGMLISWAERAAASGERILELLDAEPEVEDHPQARVLSPGPGGIEFEAVTFGYDDDLILRGADLRIEPGETVALVGPTGSGKTTLAHLLLRFYDPTSGRVLLDGADLREATLASLRAQVGLVEQDPFLFSLSIRDNIRYGRPEAGDDEVAAAARAAAAEDFILEMPQGYDTVVGERGVTLSGGQRQRLALARALLTEPRVLILDDATSSVDAETEQRILGVLGDVKGTRTMLVIAHRPSTVMLADRVVLMEGGVVVQHGPPEEVLWEESLLRDAEESIQKQLAAAFREEAV